MSAAHRIYARHLRSRLAVADLPGHVAIVMDGNRRWARQMGFGDPRVGHRHGAEHVDEVLGWCAEAGIHHVTVFATSADNLRKREPGEIGSLMALIEEVATEQLARPGNRWQLHVAGQLDVLPDSTRLALKRAEEATREQAAGFHLNVAIGYDGREEIVNAVRLLLEDRALAGATLEDVAEGLTAGQIAAHLYTGGQPDPDLIIRTSGERRLSGFLLWQAVHSELYFCDVYWPGFRKIDFLRALRTYTARRRRASEPPASA